MLIINNGRFGRVILGIFLLVSASVSVAEAPPTSVDRGLKNAQIARTWLNADSGITIGCAIKKSNPECSIKSAPEKRIKGRKVVNSCEWNDATKYWKCTVTESAVKSKDDEKYIDSIVNVVSSERLEITTFFENGEKEIIVLTPH